MRALRIGLALALTAGSSATTLYAQRVSITAGTAEPASETGIEVGKRAPDFSAAWADKDQLGPADQPFTLKQAAGKPVVLAFYPKDFTSGCTAEMTTFTEQYADLFGPDVIVVGISADSLETHKLFADSLKMPFKLLSDPDQKVAELYGSKGDGGYNHRTVFVIGRDGKVVYRNMEFGAVDPTAYDDLKTALRQAKK